MSKVESDPPFAPVEVELKLRLPPDAAARVLRHPAVVAAKRGRARRERLAATYFDTHDFRLADARLALRIRREGARWVQAIKGPAQDASGAGLAARTEIEWRLPASGRPPPLAVDALLASPFHAPIAKAMRKGALQPVFETAFARTTLPLAFDDGTRADLCVDVGEVRAAAGGARARKLPLCEIEIELREGDARRLFDFAQALAADLPVAIETTSKAERGYALLRGGRPAATHAQRVEIRDDATAAQALAAILGECMRQVERNADGVVASREPEYVHQMRVGLRRLRSALAIAQPLLPAEPLASMNAEARSLAGTLGELRDLDVLLGHTLPPLVASDGAPAPLAPLLAPLIRTAEAKREAARRRARESVRSIRLTRLLLALGALRATPLLGADPASSGAQALAAPAREYAANVLDRRYRKLRARGERLSEATADDRHALRIAAKRMRYAAEFFASLFPRKRAARFVEALAFLQDTLGLGNDAAVALAIAGESTGAQSPATSALAGWAAAQAAGRDRAIARAWKAFGQCKPFWQAD